ncbi:MAG: DUF1302 domain-containing protein [Alphaproteobacteria bacterium]|nr:DUF1302 domain-containing protein [Alphaproteobacteria bacterium]
MKLHLGARSAVLGLTCVGLFGTVYVAGAAHAIDFRSKETGIDGSIDTTVSVGVGVRAGERDDDLVGVQNGGAANSINGDNGNLNYDQGDIYSLNASARHELLVNWENFSFFTRFNYFYDAAVMNMDTERTELTSTAERYVGRDFRLQDLYLTGDFDVVDRPMTVRVGQQVINWGESTFIQNGINAINPVDVSRLRVAGAEVRDALEPIPAVDIGIDITNNFSVEGFYQLAWRQTEIEPEGTYFSTNDFASPGGQFVHLGFGQPIVAADDPVGACVNPPVCANVPRADDRKAQDEGQFGLALRYYSPELNDTEFGFYWTRLHSRLPLISAQTGSLQGVLAGDYSSSARYFREYPEDIDQLGVSFNTTVGNTGWALAGEGSWRVDQPLQVDDVELLFAALTPLAAVDPSAAAFGQNQVGSFGFGEEIQGYREHDVFQAQATLSRVFGPNFGADQIVVVGEAGFTWVPDLPGEDELRYEGAGTFTSGNPFFTLAGLQPETQTDGFANDFSWGYRLLANASFNNAIGAVTLTPQVAFSHDVSGTTPAPVANFVDGRKIVTLSLSANYLNSWNGRISYTNYFGGGDFNLLSDRDFVAASVSYSF